MGNRRRRSWLYIRNRCSLGKTRWRADLIAKLNLCPKLNNVAGSQGTRPADALPIDVGAIDGVQILDEVSCPTPGDAGVLARHPRVIHLEITLPVPTYGGRRRI